MSILITRKNLEKTFLTEWADRTLVYSSNVKISPAGAPFVVFQMSAAQSVQPCLGRPEGGTWERDFGDVVLGVHVPVDWDQDGLSLAEDARLILSQKRFVETVTDVGYTVPAGIAEQYPSYYVYSVRIPYRTDNLKA